MSLGISAQQLTSKLVAEVLAVIYRGGAPDEVLAQTLKLGKEGGILLVCQVRFLHLLHRLDERRGDKGAAVLVSEEAFGRRKCRLQGSVIVKVCRCHC
jgi:hypothetical protein